MSKCVDRLLQKSSFTGFRFLISAVLVVNCQENNEEDRIKLVKKAIFKSKEKFSFSLVINAEHCSVNSRQKAQFGVDLLNTPINIITEMQAAGIANQEEVDIVTKRITKILVKSMSTEGDRFKRIAEIAELMTQQRGVS